MPSGSSTENESPAITEARVCSGLSLQERGINLKAQIEGCIKLLGKYGFGGSGGIRICGDRKSFTEVLILSI